MGAVSTRDWRRFVYESVGVARWKDPDDAAKHPKWPGGAPEGKGGQWAPKAGALANEAQSVRQALLTGAVENMRTLSDEHVQAGIHESDCAVADVGGVKAFLKKGSDAEHEYAAYVVSRMLGMDGRQLFVDVSETVLREYGWTAKWMGTKYNIEALTSRQSPEKVAFAQFRDGAKPGGHAGNARTRDLYNLAVFDALIGQTDRHPWNRMMDSSGHIIAVDHGFAFWGAAGYNDAAHELWANRGRLGAESFFGEGPLVGVPPVPGTVLRLAPHARKALTRFVRQATSPKGKKMLLEGLSNTDINWLVRQANEMLHDGYVPGFEE